MKKTKSKEKLLIMTLLGMAATVVTACIAPGQQPCPAVNGNCTLVDSEQTYDGLIFLPPHTTGAYTANLQGPAECEYWCGIYYPFFYQDFGNSVNNFSGRCSGDSGTGTDGGSGT